MHGFCMMTRESSCLSAVWNKMVADAEPAHLRLAARASHYGCARPFQPYVWGAHEQRRIILQ